MYYDRSLSSSFSNLLEKGGQLRWLYNFVRENNDLDFQIGATKGRREWISIYRGLTRIMRIAPIGSNGLIACDANQKYMQKVPNLYGKNKSASLLSKKHLDSLLASVRTDATFKRYYDSKKEGFYQNCFSRQYGIEGKASDEFVIVDKEVVIGYEDEAEKTRLFNPTQSKYKSLLEQISKKNAVRYGKNLGKKAIGNELDFLALRRDGNLLLIEFKHGTNTSGVYLSPLQIGLYYDLFVNFRQQNRQCFDSAVFHMVKQKQQIGLICPQWQRPSTISGIIPVLVISQYNSRSSGKKKFYEILKHLQANHNRRHLSNLEVYTYDPSTGLGSW